MSGYADRLSDTAGSERRMPGRRAFATGLTAVTVALATRSVATPTFISWHDIMTPSNLKNVQAGVLDVAYFEQGPSGGAPVVLLHGFPYDALSYAEVAPLLAAAGRRVIVPYLRGYGATRFLSDGTPRVGQQAALAADLLALLDALRIGRATLAGYDWGGRTGCVIAALHPDRVAGLVSCGTGYNVEDAAAVLKPVEAATERRHWYWYYLNSERGAAALASDRKAYCRYLWKTFSPTWQFDDATYTRSAAAFDNPDFVAVVLHSYRYRIGGAPGDPALETVERRLSASPKITVPTVVLEGADDGVDPPAPAAKVAPHFTKLLRQTPLPGVGHNIPQEAPRAFADAIIELGR